jgi:hypothetical protein
MIAIAKTTKFFFFMTKSSRAPDYKWNPRVKFILYKLYPFCYILNRSWFGVKKLFSLSPDRAHADRTASKSV